MGISNVTGAQQAHSVYSQLQAQTPRQEQTAQAAVQSARVQKKTLGVSLGKLGIKYTEQDISFSPQAPLQNRRTSRAFGTALDTAELYGQMNRQSAFKNPEPNDSALNRRQALEAYAQSSLDDLALAASTTRRDIGKV